VKSLMNNTTRRFTLRTALVIPFVLPIVTAVGLVGYISFRNGQEAVNRLARQVRIEVASKTLRVMEDYFKTPHEITRSNINALRLNQINLQDKVALERHFFYQLQTIPLPRELYVGMPDGTIIYVAHKFDGSFIANSSNEFPKRERGNSRSICSGVESNVSSKKYQIPNVRKLA
jgi:hypothetical protein